jgi:hypothetical protein
MAFGGIGWGSGHSFPRHWLAKCASSGRQLTTVRIRQ